MLKRTKVIAFRIFFLFHLSRSREPNLQLSLALAKMSRLRLRNGQFVSKNSYVPTAGAGGHHDGHGHHVILLLTVGSEKLK